MILQRNMTRVIKQVVEAFDFYDNFSAFELCRYVGRKDHSLSTQRPLNGNETANIDTRREL